MDHFTALDPYEQQLLKVFDSHDRDNCGSLDKEGLMQLCQTLQLEEQGNELIKCLLKDKSSRATFHEFKDALLALLGKMQQQSKDNHNTNIESNNITSPEREVSPRFTYGSKKYGRRSRPRQDVVVVEGSDLEITSPVSVQRSNSQVEVSSKKRKTNYKLKRCTSLPGNNSGNPNTIAYDNSFIHNQGFDTEIVCTEEMLREAWKKLGVGEGGYLNQEELVLIFEEIGLNKLANGVLRQLNKLSFDKISFQELLEILQQDETWFDLLNSQNANSNENFADSRTFQYVTLGPDGNGFVNAEGLIEMWEQVGMHSPKELLHELGFNCRKINICELADILEKQLKGVNETTRNEFQSPHVALLQANLALYQGEIRCFKNVLEQLHAEREKLKGDVLEANKRSALLAQEVDDNHLRMEQNTINQVKLLEQRHADILKEVTEQFTKDKEQLSSLNLEFEKRITDLESEILKLRNDLLISQKYSLNIEKENSNLSIQIHDLQKDKNLLTQQIELLENERAQLQERELEETQMLRDKMKELQIENTSLKDRSDEMVSEIESLSGQIQSMRNKVSSTPTHHSLDQSMEENISFICEGVAGTKRRSDCSPTKDNIFRLNGSPRLGKVRKFTNKTSSTIDQDINLPLTSSESGFDTEIDCCDSSLSTSINNDEELIRLRARNAFLEQILLQNSIPIPDHDQDNCDKSNLSARVKQLEYLILSIKEQLGQSEQVEDIIKSLSDKLKISETKCVSVQTDFDYVSSPSASMVEEIQKLESTNSDLTSKCADLENCIDLLRNEYEQCEDYWQNKVDEERQLFELEQKQNTDKLNDLIEKMKEYEEQFAMSSQESDNKLPTIEEFNLEKQFTDLEQEYEEYRLTREEEIREKDEEIQLLKQQLELISGKQSKDASTQIHEDMYEKMKNFSSYIVEHTNRSADDMQSPSVADSSINWDFRVNNNASSTSSTLEKNSATPCRPKRTRKREMIYKKNNIDTKKTESGSSAASTIESIASSSTQFHKIDDPASTIRNMHRKIMYLEQRLRHMQFLMRKQYFEIDQTLQYYWQQLNAEKSDLQCKLRFLQEKYEHQRRICHEQSEKLERSDVLVKDLYVENSYLIATVQKLEQRCNMLSQCSHTNSV